VENDEVDDETFEILEVLGDLDRKDCHRILEVLSDGDEWIPGSIAAVASVDGMMVLLGFLEIRLLIIRRFGYYRISKDGMEVLQALRILDAEDREGAGNLEDPAQSGAGRVVAAHSVHSSPRRR
jgi:hypothetical protein